MVIVKTRAEIEAIVGSQSVGWLAISRKQDASTFHPGHEQLVQYSKANYDLTVVAFWDAIEIMYEIYKKESFQNLVGRAWDSTGCIEWCEAQGVDYVLMPDTGYTATYLQGAGFDSTSTLEWVDGVWDANGYPAYPSGTPGQYNAMLRMKSVVVMYYLKEPFNITYLSSWKDGEAKFIFQDYIDNYLPANDQYVTIDPVKSPEGIYYSSAYFSYTTEEKAVLAQIESTVNSVGYSDTTSLISALNALDTGVGFEVRRIEVMIGGFCGANNDFIDVYYKIGDHVDTYPIYKKGVR